ncbi:MAG: hypothetical protein Q8O99_05090 [bacterium]|nr:hypothetical protein [bacterium]
MKTDMYKDWIGKNVVLRVNALAHINYAGTLKGAEGSLVKLVKVTPVGESRQLPDMIVNLSCPIYSSLELDESEQRFPRRKLQ